MVLGAQALERNFMNNDLMHVDNSYEQTLASLADRYGKRIAYF